MESSSSLQICSPVERSPISPSNPSISIPMSPSATPQQKGIFTDTSISIQRSLSSPPRQQKRIITAQSELEEIITEDGILCMILSSLTVREAVRTSVLSSRWRPIWTSLTKFYFNAKTVLNVPTPPGCRIDGYNQTNNFIQAVNLVLQQVQGGRVDRFSVQYFLDKNHSQYLDAWVRFAVASKVKFLRLQLFRPYSYSWSYPWSNRYDFPCHLLGSSQFIETLNLMTCSFKLPFTFDGLRHLRTLILDAVDLSEEDFACILSNCSGTLVKLAVRNDWQRDSISFPHPLNQLQSLLVINCRELSKIDINAENLRVLKYEGFPIIFSFQQSPNLNKADIRFKTGGTIDNIFFYLVKLSHSLPHLHFLTLKVSRDSKVADFPTGSSCCFGYLKHLDLEWNARVKLSLVHLATLLDAAPYMEELKLHFSTVIQQPPHTPRKSWEMLPEHHHTHIKTVELRGFYFETWQIEIAVYLLKNATVLQSMRIKKSTEPIWSISKKRRNSGKKILFQKPTKAKIVIL